MSQTNLAELQRAAASFRQGDFAAALAVCDRVLAHSPRDFEAQHLKALALGRLGRIDEAVIAYGIAAESHPQKGAVFTNLGNALLAAGRIDEAVVAYRSATIKEPRFANGWCCLGAALEKQADFTGAEAALREALRVDPRHAATFNNLGVLYHRQERFEEAVREFDAALSADSNLLSALMNRGKALEKLGRNDDAIADYRKAVALAPRRQEPQVLLARALRSSQRFDEAIAAFRAAIALAPEDTEVHRDFARMLWELGKTDFLADLDRTIAALPAAPLLALRAELALLAGDVEGGRIAASRVLSIKPDDAAGSGVLARIARSEGDLERAISIMQSAYGANRENFDVLHALAEALLNAGKYEEAAKLLAGDAPALHLQRHIALRSLAWRATGDNSYKEYYDYDRFAAKLFIDPPPGYASLEEFNTALEAALRPLHRTAVRPLDQTLYGGTQSFGRLWNEPNPVIQALAGALMATARRYVQNLPDDPNHPFLARKTEDLVCAGAWSVILSSEGGHVDHFHPAGWISASYYVRVPAEVTAGEKAGFIRLGGSGVAGVDLPAERWIKPEEGAVILFPSYIWHGVEPFRSASPRITAPFDLAPR